MNNIIKIYQNNFSESLFDVFPLFHLLTLSELLLPPNLGLGFIKLVFDLDILLNFTLNVFAAFVSLLLAHTSNPTFPWLIAIFAGVTFLIEDYYLLYPSLSSCLGVITP